MPACTGTSVLTGAHGIQVKPSIKIEGLLSFSFAIFT
jgi:hypothetical protein